MGAYCPGCGGTRAVGALLEGNLAKAFYYNAGLCILGIICILLYAEYALGIKILPRKGIIWAVFGIIMFLYYVLRNFFIAI